jgi:hypothetical protein
MATLAEQKRAVLNSVTIADLLIHGITSFTVPCQCAYRHDQITCPYCSGRGSLRYKVDEIEFD